MKKLLIALLLAAPCFAASPTTCYAVANASAWNTPAAWSATSGGAGGTCTASGGAGLTIRGVTTTFTAYSAGVTGGVPGAANSHDLVVINSGITIHIAAGEGVDLSIKTNPSGGDAYTLNGNLVVDNKALIRTTGSSSSANNYGTVNGKLQIMPGGSHWITAGANSPTLTINSGGNGYVGCLDQTAYPTPFCPGNAGGWVTASVGTTLNITATTALPAGLATGDLVELVSPQSPLSWGFPYTAIDGVTRPPAPPVMPTASQSSGTAATLCGSATTCQIPHATPLCVVAISVLSVSVGWPLGGNPAQPYCTGSETAINITTAGSGNLWLFKPAFFWGDPTAIAWNVPYSQTWTSGSPQVGYFDAIRSGLGISNAPISNAAGTGPGRLGDNSLTLSLTTPALSSCTFLKPQDVTSAGCYLNYDKGQILAYGFGVGFIGSVSFTGATNPSAGYFSGSVNVGSGGSLIIGNADIRYFDKDYSDSVIQATGTANFAFEYNTVRMSNGLIGLGGGLFSTAGYSPSSTAPINFNSWMSSNYNANLSGNIHWWGNTSNVDISNNYVNDYHPFFGCKSTITNQFIVFSGSTITNNNVLDDEFISGQNSPACQMTGNRIQQNRIVGNGVQDNAASGWPSYVFPFTGIDNPTINQPNLVQYNLVYGNFRCIHSSRGTVWYRNACVNQWHHEVVMGSAESYSGGLAGNGEVFENNLFASYDQNSQAIDGFDIGYAESMLVDGLTIRNNTFAGMHASCIRVGDTDGLSYQMLMNLTIMNNVCSPSTGGPLMSKQITQSPIMTQAQLSSVYNNSIEGTNTPYLGIVTNTNNIPNPEYNRNIRVTDSTGANYNTSTTRHVTGVAIQNPLYSTSQTNGTLAFTRTSASDMTLSWNGGTPVQLNWGGAGVTYALSSVTDPGFVHQYLQIVTTTTPFTALPGGQGVATPAGCPVARWALMNTGTKSGTAYYISNCTSTSGLNFVPHTTGIATNDTFSVIKSEVRLFDSGGTNYVDVGIDARALPGSSQTDTGINLNLTDYCTGPCASAAVISGLPNSMTTGTTGSPLVPFSFLPLTGASAESIFCPSGTWPCAGGTYESAGTAWKSAGTNSNYIGAVNPSTPAVAPTAILP